MVAHPLVAAASVAEFTNVKLYILFYTRLHSLTLSGVFATEKKNYLEHP